MKDQELVALLYGREAGRVHRRGDRMSFTYDDAWRRRDDVTPISLSMPLAGATHGHRPIEAYMWGLLPDNDRVLKAWGREFHVSSANPFALLAHVGEDCAGAIQFVAPDRASALLEERPPEIAWQTEKAIATHIRRLRDDPAAWRDARGRGQFSLAGAQRKTALYFEAGRWGIPSGRTPTTHILKPPIPGFNGHVENEHFCLRLAREVGLAAATSEVRRFDGESVIVVTRYDRVRLSDLAEQPPPPRTSAPRAGARAIAERARTLPVLRVHQEDMCQALAVHPDLKYQSQRGPTPKEIVRLLREQSGNPVADVAAFVDALIFNWLILGTDAHAKNYAVLHQQSGLPRLAPLYDLASILPYPEAQTDAGRVKLAMHVGSEYRDRNIRRRHWIELAENLGLNADATLVRAAELAQRVGPAAVAIGRELRAEGIDHPIVPRLAEMLPARAAACLRILARGGDTQIRL